MKARGPWFVGAACATALTWLFPESALAMDTAPSAKASGQLAALEVSIEFAAVPFAEQLAAKTAAWFAGGTLRFSSREREPVDTEAWLGSVGSGLRVLVDGRNSENLRLWFVLESTGARKYLFREQSLPNGLDEIALENVAQLIFSSAHALAEGREETPVEQLAERFQRTPRAAAPEERLPERLPSARRRELSEVRSEAAPVSSHRRRGSGPRLAAAAGYELRLSGPEGLFHGPWLSLGLRQQHARWEHALAGAVTLVVPTRFEQTDYAVELRGYSARVEAFAARTVTTALQTGVTTALGVDWLWLNPSSLSSQRFTAGSSRRSLRAFAALGVGLWFRLGALRASTALECVAHFSRAHYDVEEDGVRRESVTAWPLQPALRVALRW